MKRSILVNLRFFMHFYLMNILAWLILVLSFIVASIGTILPGLPGAAIAVIGIWIHKWLLPDYLPWWVVITCTALGIISWVVDVLAGLLGAHVGGATRNGLIGAAIGGVIGLAFGLPGLFLGPFIGAIAGDLYSNRRNFEQLMRSGIGAASGQILSLLARFIILIIMASLILISILGQITMPTLT